MHTKEMSSLPPKYFQQEEFLTPECHNLISSLPREKAWIASYLYLYQGFWFPARNLQGVISTQKHFQVQDSDIFLVTTPKSGTTWLKAIMFTLLNRKRHRIEQNHPLLTHNPHHLVPLLESGHYSYGKAPDIASSSSPRLFATHAPYVSLPEAVKESSSCKIVYLCRNPKAAFVSLFHFSNMLRPREIGENSIEEVFELFCKGVSGYGPFWDHVMAYWRKFQEDSRRVFFLRYEDLKEEPRVHLRRLAEFLDCPFSAEEEESGLVEGILKLCSFENLSSLDVNKSGRVPSSEIENKSFFRRGEVGDWKNYLSAEMAEKVDQITENKFSGLGLVL